LIVGHSYRRNCGRVKVGAGILVKHLKEGHDLHVHVSRRAVRFGCALPGDDEGPRESGVVVLLAIEGGAVEPHDGAFVPGPCSRNTCVEEQVGFPLSKSSLVYKVVLLAVPGGAVKAQYGALSSPGFAKHLASVSSRREAENGLKTGDPLLLKPGVSWGWGGGATRGSSGHQGLQLLTVEKLPR
jgi:hypothetical protein